MYHRGRVNLPLAHTLRTVTRTNPLSFLLLLAGLTALGLLDGRPASAQILFAVDSNSDSVTKVAPDGSTTSFVSTGLNNPIGAAFDPLGNLYVSNFAGNNVKKITPDGEVSVFVRTGLSGPGGLAFDAVGNLYVANYTGNTMEKFTPGGTALAFAAAGLNDPAGLAFDASGNQRETRVEVRLREEVQPAHRFQRRARRVVEAPGFQVRRRETVVRLDVVRIEHQRPPERCFRLLPTPRPLVRFTA